MDGAHRQRTGIGTDISSSQYNAHSFKYRIARVKTVMLENGRAK
jgi:hypothetical protein